MSINPFNCLTNTIKNLFGCKSKQKGEEFAEEEEFDFITVPQYYHCTKCHRIPEIVSIHKDTGIVKLKCKIHGEIKINVLDYIKKKEKDKKDDEYQCECGEEVVAFYCSECKKYVCSTCNEQHKKENHTTTNIEDNEEKYFCFKCEDIISKEELEKHKIQIHKNENPKIVNVKEYKTNEELSKNIGNIREKVKEENKKIEKMIRFNQVFCYTYEKYPSNYFHIQSSMNLDESIKSEMTRNSQEFDYLLSELEDKKKTSKKEIDELKKINIVLSEKDEKLTLYNRDINNTKFEKISNVLFIKLKKLDLSNNKISDVECLNNMHLPHLEVFDMSHNEIVEIKPIAELICKELKELCIQHNKIKNIKPLVDSDFPKLKLLRIEDNQYDKNDESYKKLLEKYGQQMNHKIMSVKDFNKEYKRYIMDDNALEEKKMEN